MTIETITEHGDPNPDPERDDSNLPAQADALPLTLSILRRQGHAAETPVSAAKFVHGLSQVLTREHRPHSRREHHLGVSAFPQQKIAQTLFAAGADQQIHIRPEMFRQTLFRNGHR